MEFIKRQHLTSAFFLSQCSAQRPSLSSNYWTRLTSRQFRLLGPGQSRARGVPPFRFATGHSNTCNLLCLDLDLEELTNEVDGLETLAKEMQVLSIKGVDNLFIPFTQTLVRLNNADNNKREKLTKTRDQRPDRPKGGKRKKKQAKRPKAQRKIGKVSSSKSGGGSSVTLCQVSWKF